MTFDDGYDTGEVYRLSFNHSVAREDGAPFARRDVVVLKDNGDAIVGHYATVSDKTRGSIHDDPEDDADPKHRVRVKDRLLTIRKSAVVMKRLFGTVDGTEVTVTEDPTGKYADDGGV